MPGVLIDCRVATTLLAALEASVFVPTNAAWLATAMAPVTAGTVPFSSPLTSHTGGSAASVVLHTPV